MINVETMIRRTKIGTLLLAALLGAGVIITSCNKEEVISQPEKKHETSDIIRFGINMLNNWLPDIIGENAPDAATKSQGAKYTESLPMDCLEGEGPGTEIHMYMIEEDIPPVVDTVDTKAGETTPDYVYGLYAYQVPNSAVNTDNPVYDGSKASVFNDMNNLGLTADGESYAGGDKYWPGSAWWLKFYLYSPYHAVKDDYFKISEVTGEPKFTYTVPTDIASQYDIMSGTSALINGSNTSEVEITFSHLLSQINVKAGTLDEGTIHYIKFTNIYNQGDRIMATLDNDGGWTLLPVDGPTKTDYVHTYGDGGIPVSNFHGGDIYISKDETQPIKPMYLLPQTLSDDATIEIKLTVSSPDPNNEGQSRTQEYVLSKKLSDFIGEWKPNKKYTYVISTPEEVEVDITDEITYTAEGYPKKENLVIKNNGLSTVYVRASIIGNWVMPDEDEEYDDDLSVAPWQQVNDAAEGKVADGSFVYNGGQGPKLPDTDGSTIGNWICIGGYYYYTKPLTSGQEISGSEQLFTSYTLTAQPPMANAVFDLSILVQAVYSEDVTIGWPVTKGTDDTLTAKTSGQ